MLSEHGAELHGALERALRRFVRAEFLLIDDVAVLARRAQRPGHRRTAHRARRDTPVDVADLVADLVRAEALELGVAAAHAEAGGFMKFAEDPRSSKRSS